MDIKKEKSNLKANISRIILIASFLLMLVFAFWHNRLIRHSKFSIEFMGTQTNIIAIARTEKIADAAIAAAQEQLDIVQKLMSYHDPNSQLSMLNRSAFDEPFKPDKMLFDVIKKSLYYSQISDGQFDITIGALLDLWQHAKIMPTSEEIETAKSKVGYEKLIIDDANQTIQFQVEGTKIDLGAIAKGYGIDLAIEAVKSAGAAGGLVDVGGDIRCFGETEKGKSMFSVGLQNPANVSDNEQPELLSVFQISDCAIATSGDYQRFVQIQGEKVSHIISPKTKKSAKMYSSVSVIAPKAADADALATTLSMLDAESGLKIINQLENTEALLIPSAPNQKWIKSGGIDKFLK